MGFLNTSGIGSGVEWLDPTKSFKIIVWCHSWPSNIPDALISETNPGWMLTNSDLNLFALILHKATLLEVLPKVSITVPRSVSDNTSTVS